jgi:hypothetical protein
MIARTHFIPSLALPSRGRKRKFLTRDMRTGAWHGLDCRHFRRLDIHAYADESMAHRGGETAGGADGFYLRYASSGAVSLKSSERVRYGSILSFASSAW